MRPIHYWILMIFFFVRDSTFISINFKTKRTYRIKLRGSCSLKEWVGVVKTMYGEPEIFIS